MRISVKTVKLWLHYDMKIELGVLLVLMKKAVPIQTKHVSEGERKEKSGFADLPFQFTSFSLTFPLSL